MDTDLAKMSANDLVEVFDAVVDEHNNPSYLARLRAEIVRRLRERPNRGGPGMIDDGDLVDNYIRSRRRRTTAAVNRYRGMILIRLNPRPAPPTGVFKITN